MGAVDWSDNARDIIQFLVHYRPCPEAELYYKTSLPVHLPRLPEAIVSARLSKGLLGSDSGTQLVAVGHSFGGCSLTLAVATHRTLFKTLVLIDPVIVAPYSYNPMPKVRGGLRRRSQWAGRREARTLLANNPFFARWNPSVLDIYVECGLIEDDDTAPASPARPVKLKMPPMQEAIVFAELRASYEAWERLPEISEEVELRWIMPGEWFLGGKQATIERIWRRPANSSHVVVEGAGHLIPQEKPEALAQALESFLMKRFRDNGRGDKRNANL